MKALTLEQEVTLLEKIHHAGPIETFIHFPEIILSGTAALEPEDLAYLLDKGYLVEKRRDSFGSIFGLSSFAMQCLRQISLSHKKSKDKYQHQTDIALVSTP